MTLLCAPCQMQHGAAEAPFLDFQATHTLGRSQGHAYLLTLYMGAEEPAGKTKEGPPTLCLRVFILFQRFCGVSSMGAVGFIPYSFPGFCFSLGMG